jgi:hypothetical protein
VACAEIEHYLSTGEYDLLFRSFDGAGTLDRIQRGSRAIVEALVAEVHARSANCLFVHEKRIPSDLEGFTSALVTPMVKGMFSRKEVPVIVDLLKSSVHFVTPLSFADLLRNETPETAWHIANLYLNGLDLASLSDLSPSLVGLAVGNRCYISMKYFEEEDPFADFVVHEAAHIFHNVKRETVGLPSTRTREWLLPIRYQKRETFAYACEAYSRILLLSGSAAEQKQRYAELVKSFSPPDERVNVSEYHDLIRNAVASRNGWRRILEYCS